MVIILYLWYIQNDAPKLLLMAQPLKHPQSESVEKWVLPSIFWHKSFILDDVKLAELSNNSFEWKNLTLLGVKTYSDPTLYIFTGVNISQAPESVPLLVPSYYTVARSITLSELNPRFNVMLLFKSNIWKMAPNGSIGKSHSKMSSLSLSTTLRTFNLHFKVTNYWPTMRLSPDYYDLMLAI